MIVQIEFSILSTNCYARNNTNAKCGKEGKYCAHYNCPIIEKGMRTPEEITKSAMEKFKYPPTMTNKTSGWYC